MTDIDKWFDEEEKKERERKDKKEQTFRLASLALALDAGLKTDPFYLGC